MKACRKLFADGSASSLRQHLVFFLNGKRVEVANPDPSKTLIEHLREEHRLTGTKLGCGEGGCGACTVTLTRAEYGEASGAVRHRHVNACLVPLCSVDGCHVTTVEGIGTAEAPHPAQERIAKLHGSQCGYCTPGFVMSLYTALQQQPGPLPLKESEEVFGGNLCRCTGYRPLFDAAKTFTVPFGTIKTVRSNKVSPDASAKIAVVSTTEGKIQDSADGNCEFLTQVPAYAPPAFPEELAQIRKEPLHFRGPNGVEWYRPNSKDALLTLKASLGARAKIVGGSSELRIETKMKGLKYPCYISTAAVEELHAVSVGTDGSISIGGSTTLAALEHQLKGAIAHGVVAAEHSGIIEAILRLLPWFASPQIRNVATVAGNVATASPIADLNPILLAANADLVLESAGRDPRTVSLGDFFVGYRRTRMEESEVITRINVRGTTAGETFAVYKQARRREDDISLVCAALTARVQGGQLAGFRGAFGGVGPTTQLTPKLADALSGFKVGEATAESILGLAQAAVDRQFAFDKNVPGGMPAYRPTVAAAFVAKFLGEICGLKDLADDYLKHEKPLTQGTQAYTIEPRGGGLHHSAAGVGTHRVSADVERGVVGLPLPHRSSLLQASGEAVYVDDMPSPAGTVHCALVLSDRPLGIIESIDPSAALAAPGVVAFFSAKDLTDEQNKIGAIELDEELFRRRFVTCAGQTVGMVVATTHEGALAAANRVVVRYGAVAEQPVISIRQSVAANKEHSTHHVVTDGEPEGVFGRPDVVVVEGEVRMGGQEHFYLETNATLAVPAETGELVLYCSSQSTHMCQKFAARACGLPWNQVVCRVKRMGGGFGGKESRVAFISSIVALAAHRLKRPCRINIERQQDMLITGTRHPFAGKYKVAADSTGRIVAADVDVYNNAGWSADLSSSVMDRALFHIANAYKIPHLTARGHICLTNTVTNTAFRGFGGPQGMMICENYLEHVADTMSLTPEAVRKINLMPECGRTHYGQLVKNNNLARLWSEIEDRADIAARRQTISAFNNESRFRKRGLAVIPTMFGINFTAEMLNQAGALVNVYQDGSVLITHGGTEMGQGLHTKVLQVAARALGIPYEKVYIAETASDKTPNASPTAASVGSDIYGMAVLDACEQLNARLAPYWERIAGKDSLRPRDPSQFPSVVMAAWLERVNLSAQGFYATPGGGYDWNKSLPRGACNSGRGEPFNYYTFGVAASEVEIDVLTGDMRTQRTDIVMDLGQSLNPAIDIGQIEGAFVQGLGWCTLEEWIWGGAENAWFPAGQCFTRGPGNYKLPSGNDIPLDFRVTLLSDAKNPKAIHSSKAVGEPPLFLSASAFFAGRDAIRAARKANGITGHFAVDSPLTPERIRMACGDQTAETFSRRVVDQGGQATPALFC